MELVRGESVKGVNSLFLPLHFQQFWVLSSGNRNVPTGESSVVREGVCMWAGAQKLLPCNSYEIEVTGD